jgi:hypothetical protein
VVQVAEVEEVRHRRVAPRRGRLRVVLREVEDARRAAVRARQVGHVVRVQVEVRVDVVSLRVRVEVVDPAVRRVRDRARRDEHERARDERELRAARRRVAGDPGGGAVCV